MQEIADLCSKEASTGRPKHHDLIMLKLFIIQAMYGMTDSVVSEFFRENMYFQYFYGFETVDTSYKISESCIRRFRKKLGEEGMTSLIEYAIQVAVAHDIIKKETSRKLYLYNRPRKKYYPPDRRLTLEQSAPRITKYLRTLLDKTELNIRQVFHTHEQENPSELQGRQQI